MLSTKRTAITAVGRRVLYNQCSHLHYYCQRRHAHNGNKPTHHIQGYQAMGSFHSENVDDLMAQSDTQYQSPSLPFDPDASNTILLQDTYTSQTPSDKDNYWEQAFSLDRKQWTFLNHGAFGGALVAGQVRAAQWRWHLEQQPLRYFDRDLLPHLVESARQLAAFCGLPGTMGHPGFTLIPNVTYGLTTVLRGHARLQRQQGRPSVVILWDTSYGSLKKMARQLCDVVIETPLLEYLAKAKVNNPTPYHPDFDSICVQAMSETLDQYQQQHKSYRAFDHALLVLDHTTSNTAINMPLVPLATFAKQQYGKDLRVLVDGAHGILAQPLHLPELCGNTDTLGPIDIYLGNGHKWLSCPRGIGFMYCPSSSLQETLLEEPAVMSHGIGQGLQSRFLWDGCRDYAAALSIPAVLDVWNHGDPSNPVGQDDSSSIEQIQAKIANLSRAAVQLLAQAWYPDQPTETCTLVPMEHHAPMMTLVRLPDHLQVSNQMATSDHAKQIQDSLFDQHIEVPIKCIQGVLYVRISCHVYNALEEYDRLGRVLKVQTKIE